MKKRGQFYLIAAVIIIVALIGFVVTTNLVFEHKISDRDEDIQEEINLESEYVINHGVFKEKNQDDLMKQFAQNYSSYLGKDRDVLFVYGNESSQNLHYVSLFDVRNQISVSIGGGTPSKINVDVRDIEFGDIGGGSGSEIEIEIGDTNYDFKLNKGENFYFIIRQPEEE